MKVNDLLISNKESTLIETIRDECSQFIYQSDGFPLLKNLPKSYNDFYRVKVRKRKGDSVSTHFNEAFDYHQLRQRAVFANGFESLEEASENDTPFYIFPINGYRFTYQNNVQNSNDDYKKSFNSILESLGDEKGGEVISDMLQFSYVDNENLAEGIKNGAEIIIYNIPYFYALRDSIVDNYEDFYSTLA